MKKLLLSLLLFVTFFNVKSQDLMNLKPTGFVNDYEQIFSTDEKNKLEKMLSDYAKTTTAEICIVTSDSFPAGDHIEATNLFNKWGIGSKELNNGLLFVLSKSQRKYSIVTGYGLEEFLPDGKLNQFVPNMTDSFRVGNYYAGAKGLILDVQKELGYQGLEFLRKQKELRAAESTKRLKDILSTLFYVFLLIIILGCIGYIIYTQYEKRQKFLKLKKEVQILIDNIAVVKKQLGNKIDTNNKFSIIEKLENKLITEETRSHMQLIYNKLLENKQIVNSIDNSITNISKIKSDIQNYLNNNYTYCEIYLKEYLNQINTDFNGLEINEYTKSKADKLIGIQSVLDNKMKIFSKSLLTIHNIVSDYNNLEKKNSELKTLYLEYIRKKNILSSVKIGNKYNSLIIFNFDENLNKIKNYISHSFLNLEKGDFTTADFNFGNYITTSTIITNTFSSVDLLFNNYNNSEKFVKDNMNKITKLNNDIDYKINKSGVSYSRKTTYGSIKTEILKCKNNVEIDIILSAEILKKCISDLESLLNKINSDIFSHEESIRRTAAVAAATIAAAARRRNDDSSSSGGGFSGFSGGGSGGGGVSGSF